MPGLQKITHKGKEIVYIDYRGQSEEEMLKTASDLSSSGESGFWPLRFRGKPKSKKVQKKTKDLLAPRNGIIWFFPNV